MAIRGSATPKVLPRGGLAEQGTKATRGHVLRFGRRFKTFSGLLELAAPDAAEVGCHLFPLPRVGVIGWDQKA